MSTLFPADATSDWIVLGLIVTFGECRPYRKSRPQPNTSERLLGIPRDGRLATTSATRSRPRTTVGLCAFPMRVPGYLSKSPPRQRPRGVPGNRG